MKNLYILFYLFFSVNSYSMIADITEDVETEFGTYHPYLVDITPACTTYTIDSGFINVANFDTFTFTACEESLLFQNAFTATPSSYMEMYDIYNEAREREIPIFVSCDALLHTYHILYDKLLQTAELKQLIKDIVNLTDTLYFKIKDSWESTSNPSVKEALRFDLAYISVAKCLLDTTFTPQPEVKALVDSELVFIKTHNGYQWSPIFDYYEDYSQYIPRGHYTKSDTLERYFRAMMWYGRMTFAIKTNGEPDILHTRMAVLLIHSMHNINVAGETGIEVWERVYLPTVFFVGKTDDINIYQYTKIMEEVYGTNFASLPPDSFAHDLLLNEFIAKADLLPLPAIPTSAPKGFRFMGQRFIPDSWIFSELTFDRIPGLRYFPKGLDVMAVLGSDRAYEILDQVYGETSYEGYPEKMASLKVHFSALPDATWAQNLYWNWLYCLMPFTFAKGSGFPSFMQSTAWLNKELYAALGSWTELRHDTILYAKQSEGPIGDPPPEPPTIHGYVEPNPWFFARLASLVKYTKDGLKNLNLLYDDYEPRLVGLETLLLALKTIAEKELTNQDISYKEDRAICGIGAEIGELVAFEGYSKYGDEYLGPYPDDTTHMPVIADVHTDPNTNRCLEEGVGYPFNLYVIVPLNGNLMVTWGAGFSYYEFKQPISNRLTDEAWQNILQTDPPDVPVWASTFIDTSQLGPISNPRHYYSDGKWEIQRFGVEEQEVKISGPSLKIFPNPFTSKTVIEFFVGTGRDLSLLQICDLSGRLVKSFLINQSTNQPINSITWDAKDYPSGIYFLKFSAGKYEAIKKLILLK